MKQRILLTLFASLYTLYSFAYLGKEIDGIFYWLDEDIMIAIVAPKSGGYTGHITIPSTVWYSYHDSNNNVHYKYFTVTKHHYFYRNRNVLWLY